jgi:hypothetical protein
MPRKLSPQEIEAARRRTSRLQAEANIAVENARKVLDKLRNAAQLRANRRALRKLSKGK